MLLAVCIPVQQHSSRPVFPYLMNIISISIIHVTGPDVNIQMLQVNASVRLITRIIHLSLLTNVEGIDISKAGKAL